MHRDTPVSFSLMAEGIMWAWETSVAAPELRRKFDDDEDEFEDDGFTFDDDEDEDDEVDDEEDLDDEDDFEEEEDLR